MGIFCHVSALLQFLLNKMESLKEQRIPVKLLGKTTSEIHKILQKAFVDEAMGWTKCPEWVFSIQSKTNVS